jgi:nitrate reductase NapAB chaperone NapD
LLGEVPFIQEEEMVIASGFIEANGVNDVERVVDELKTRGVEVNEVKDEKIVFLVERETAQEVKNSLDSLKDIDGVRSVYLAYYSLEGNDRDIENLLPFNTH